MLQHEPADGFDCASGCIGPEACMNTLQIRALHLSRKALSATVENPEAVETLKTVHGNLGSIETRTIHLKQQHAALYNACGLYQLEADGLMTEVINIADMPPLDE